MQVERKVPALAGTWTLALVLLAGVLIGSMADFRGLREALFPRRAGAASESLPERSGAVASAALQTINIEISPLGMKTLAKARLDAIARGQIVRADMSEVDAVVTCGSEKRKARVRIKGDWTDHVESDKVSLRIAVGGGTVLGMSEFSVQSPKTRGYLAEWLAQSVARREGLLVPRSTFVNVSLNGRNNGVYFLEEHFNKEMLESQQRREGPVMRFDEGAMWSHRFEGKARHANGIDGISVVTDATAETSVIGAFGNDTVSPESPYGKQLASAFEAMQGLQRCLADRRSSGGAPLTPGAPGVYLDIAQTAKVHALMRLFNSWHGLVWHNLRFYYNPVTARLEPVLFDTGAFEAGMYFRSDDIATSVGFEQHTLASMLMDDPGYAIAFYQALGAYSDPEFLAKAEREVRSQMDSFAGALASDGSLPTDATPDALLSAIRAVAQRLSETIRPTAAALFTCTAPVSAIGDHGEADIAEIDAWSATRVPVVLKGFRFSNGRFVSAAETAGQDPTVTKREDGSVVLPTDRSRAKLKLALDRRLSGLIEVKQIKDAVKSGSGAIATPDTQVFAVFHAVTRGDDSELPLTVRHAAAEGDRSVGRPASVSVEQALGAHPFLAFDAGKRVITVARGVWDVSGDLVMPEGVALHIFGGVTLRFQPGAMIFTTSSVTMHGDMSDPVLLEPKEKGKPWGGMTVLEAPRPSRLKFVRISGAASPSRGGWIHTGAVNFFRSDITIEDCRFEDSHAEDSLNVIRASIDFVRTAFDGAQSDLFDGDFVHGSIVECRFSGSVGDAIDVSGSDVTIERCRFSKITDKSVSVGERSVAKIVSCVTEDSGIGIAAKDGSRAEVHDYTLKHAKYFGLASYVKKPEIGPASLVVTSSTIEDCGRSQTICQVGSSIVVDGQPVAATEFDVDAMYDSQVLGSNPWGKKR